MPEQAYTLGFSAFIAAGASAYLGISEMAETLAYAACLFIFIGRMLRA